LKLGFRFSEELNTGIENAIKLAHRLELDILELTEDAQLKKILETKGTHRLRKAFEEHSIIVHLHAPILSFPVVSPILAERMLSTYINSIELAYEIGCDLLVIHAPQGEHSIVINIISELSSRCRELGVTLTLENGWNIGPLLRLASRYGSKLFWVTFDVGHANLSGDPYSYLIKLFRYIRNIHIHDNDGSRDLHLPLGAGTIDFSRILGFLANREYKYALVIENKSVSDVISSVIFIKNVIGE